MVIKDLQGLNFNSYTNERKFEIPFPYYSRRNRQLRSWPCEGVQRVNEHQCMIMSCKHRQKPCFCGIAFIACMQLVDGLVDPLGSSVVVFLFPVFLFIWFQCKWGSFWKWGQVSVHSTSCMDIFHTGNQCLHYTAFIQSSQQTDPFKKWPFLYLVRFSSF